MEYFLGVRNGFFITKHIDVKQRADTQLDTMSNVRIVDEIPSLHEAYADLGPNGYWVYWEKMEDGRWKWNPEWRLFDDEYWKTALADAKKELEEIERCEKETPENARTTEWFQIISARKRDAVEEIRFFESKVRFG